MEASTANTMRKVANLAALTALWASGPLLCSGIAASQASARKPAPVLAVHPDAYGDPAGQRRVRRLDGPSEYEILRY